MNEFTHEELQGIVKAISQKKPTDKDLTKIPLRPPGSYGKMAKITFSPLTPAPLADNKKKKHTLDNLNVQIEVVFGKTTLTLKELEELQEGSLLPLEELAEDPVDIFVNGTKIGRGEVIAVDDHFGIRILSFTKNPPTPNIPLNPNML